MSHTNNCRFCKYKFKFKYPYREWRQVTKLLYEKAVKRFTAIETITFMFNGKPWIISDNCGYHGDGVATGVDEYLCIELVEPLTYEQVKKKTSWNYRWPRVEQIPSDRDMNLLKKITEENAELDLCIDVYDAFGDDIHHHCGIVAIKGDEHIKIMLEEAWHHKD